MVIKRYENIKEEINLKLLQKKTYPFKDKVF